MGPPASRKRLASLCAFSVVILHVALANRHIGAQGKFDSFVGQADSLYAETRNLEASLYLLRAALQLCPNCTATTQQGQLSERIFMYDQHADRVLLTEQIIPALAEYSPQRVLWVGVQVGGVLINPYKAYSLRGLYKVKQLNATVTSIDSDENQAVFGADFHIVAPLDKLYDHVASNMYDVVIINGVIGSGIDGKKDIDAAVQKLYQSLKATGSLVVGWKKDTGTCCNFEPWFYHRNLGNLTSVIEVPNSETSHVYEIMRRNERVHLIMWPQ